MDSAEILISNKNKRDCLLQELKKSIIPVARARE